MLKRITLTAVAAAAAFGTMSVATAPFMPAAAQINITFGSPPPPVRYETVPAARSGYVWAPGQWQLVNDQYVWTEGRWQQARPGYRYVPDNWERSSSNGRDQWRYQPSRWDRDGDGIPNQYDRVDNHPKKNHGNNSANNPLGDKDRDGIPNFIDGQNNNRR
ncbi:MAG: YXWGXW repeat-containing protein [Reyranella sp.]|nr:YXWGXW repeat-containing protein [Reyranella sp.]MDP3161044.1 YXWGXW repeat-containing protein [Reyranella sp.]